MDDLRTVFHLPINDAAKKVRKKRRALAHPRQKEQQQQEQKHTWKEIFFVLGFLGALIWVPFTVCFFCSETDLGAFHSKLTALIIVLCLSSK
jgi:hypothetical protein